MLIGDSIAHQWPQELADLAFAGPVYNFGNNADTTSETLWRLERVNFSQAQLDRIVVLIGTNMIRAPTPHIVEGIHVLLDRLSIMFPKARIDYISILPRGEQLRGGEPKISGTNDALRENRDRRPYRFIDAHPRFIAACGYTDDCPLYADRIHLSPEGYKLLSRIVAEADGIKLDLDAVAASPASTPAAAVRADT